MKIVQRALIVRSELIVRFAQIDQRGQKAQNEMINLKSAENQSAHLELIVIQKLNVLKNQIVLQRQTVSILRSLPSLINQNAL
jgi:hypothetical protein